VSEGYGIGLPTLLLIIAGFVLYFIPSFIAFRRDHRHAIGIMLLNVLAGWLVLPWIASLLWALRR
jgi:hypothetical protein